MLQAGYFELGDDLFAVIWATNASHPGRVDIELRNARGDRVCGFSLRDRDTAGRLLSALLHAADYAGLLDQQAIRRLGREIANREGD